MSATIISYDGKITSPKLLRGGGRSRTPPCMMRHSNGWCRHENYGKNSISAWWSNGVARKQISDSCIFSFVAGKQISLCSKWKFEANIFDNYYKESFSYLTITALKLFAICIFTDACSQYQASLVKPWACNSHMTLRHLIKHPVNDTWR